ncbi:MAG: hypothetical protein ACLP8B_03830, partial [Xanthobacteraceae bacterium]
FLPTRSLYPPQVRNHGTLACAPRQTELDLRRRRKRRVTRMALTPVGVAETLSHDTQDQFSVWPSQG